MNNIVGADNSQISSNQGDLMESPQIEGQKPFSSFQTSVEPVTKENDDYDSWVISFGLGQTYPYTTEFALDYDGGMVFTGMTNGFHNKNYDSIISKVDNKGNVVWSKLLPESNTNIDNSGNSIKQISDGFIIVGTTSSYGSGGDDILLAKIDSDGNRFWSKAIGGKGDEIGLSVQETSDNGFVVVGSSIGSCVSLFLRDPLNGAFVVKLDTNGEFLWGNIIYSTTDSNSPFTEGVSIQETSDGDFYIYGTYSSDDAMHRDIFLAKLDSEGLYSWAKIYYTDFQGEGNGDFMLETINEDLIITGRSSSDDTILAKLDKDGNVIWAESLIINDANFDGSYRLYVFETSEGDLLMSFCNVIMKSDNSGKITWAELLSSDCSIKSIKETSEGDIVILGNYWEISVIRKPIKLVD